MAHIKTFARLKPSKKPYPGYKSSENVLSIGFVESKEMINIGASHNNARNNLSYEIVFNKIFLPETSQEQVFHDAAKDIITSKKQFAQR